MAHALPHHPAASANLPEPAHSLMSGPNALHDEPTIPSSSAVNWSAVMNSAQQMTPSPMPGAGADDFATLSPIYTLDAVKNNPY